MSMTEACIHIQRFRDAANTAIQSITAMAVPKEGEEQKPNTAIEQAFNGLKDFNQTLEAYTLHEAKRAITSIIVSSDTVDELTHLITQQQNSFTAEQFTVIASHISTLQTAFSTLRAVHVGDTPRSRGTAGGNDLRFYQQRCFKVTMGVIAAIAAIALAVIFGYIFWCII